jgi:hypothetical protein
MFNLKPEIADAARAWLFAQIQSLVSCHRFGGCTLEGCCRPPNSGTSLDGDGL